MAPRMRRGLGVRAILAGSMVALMASSLPSNAALGDPPQLVSTSVDSGWSNGNLQVTRSPNGNGLFEISARFDKTVRARYVELVDTFTGLTVAANATQPAQGGGSIIWAPAADLLTDGRYYQITFGAAAGEDTTQLPPPGNSDVYLFDHNNPPATYIEYTKTFRVDLEVPQAPLVQSPTGVTLPTMLRGADIAGTIAVVPVAEFSGYADDRLGINDSPLATSGVRAIRLRFWDVAMQVLGSNSPVKTYNAIQAGCTDVCQQKLDPWTVAIDDIPNGVSCIVCSVEIQTVDLAGNVSFPTDPITFINL